MSLSAEEREKGLRCRIPYVILEPARIGYLHEHRPLLQPPTCSWPNRLLKCERLVLERKLVVMEQVSSLQRSAIQMARTKSHYPSYFLLPISRVQQAIHARRIMLEDSVPPYSFPNPHASPSRRGTPEIIFNRPKLGQL
ncbi:hypothetical protein BT69DRAFT_1278249, partial [Atractiella rhizophila]